MTDRDVVDRVARLLHRAVVVTRPRRPGYKVPYLVSIKGTSAVALMRAVRDEMGIARRIRIDRALATWTQIADPHARSRPPRYEPIVLPAHRCDTVCQHAWLAGLLEGEGHFGMNRTGPSPYPLITLQMCSRDIVERVGHMIDAPSIRTSTPKNIAWNPTYSIQIAGASAAAWMRTLRPYMGERRTAAIDAALAAYSPIRLVDPPDTCVVPGCGAPHRSRGLCHKHYMSWLRDVAKGRTPRVTPLR